MRPYLTRGRLGWKLVSPRRNRDAEAVNSDATFIRGHIVSPFPSRTFAFTLASLFGKFACQTHTHTHNNALRHATGINQGNGAFTGNVNTNVLLKYNFQA